MAVAQGTRLALCMVLQGVCTGKHKQDEDTKVLQKASCCSPFLLMMFYAQAVPLAGF